MVITTKSLAENDHVPQKTPRSCHVYAHLAPMCEPQWRCIVEDELNLRRGFLKISNQEWPAESECCGMKFGLNSLRIFIRIWKIQNTLAKVFLGYWHKWLDAWHLNLGIFLW